ERDGVLARAGHADRLHQSLLAKMPQVARPRIERTLVLVSEITTGDHSKRSHDRERPRLRAAQRVLAIAFVNQLALRPARQIQITTEDVTRVVAAVAVAIRSRSQVVVVVEVVRSSVPRVEVARVKIHNADLPGATERPSSVRPRMTC